MANLSTLVACPAVVLCCSIQGPSVSDATLAALVTAVAEEIQCHAATQNLHRLIKEGRVSEYKVGACCPASRACMRDSAGAQQRHKLTSLPCAPSPWPPTIPNRRV